MTRWTQNRGISGRKNDAGRLKMQRGDAGIAETDGGIQAEVAGSAIKIAHGDLVVCQSRD